MVTRAVRVLELSPDADNPSFHEEELSEILLDPKIVDKKVAILSVAGALRRGKSFLLSIFERYLSAFENGEPPVGDDWLFEPETNGGFSWRGGKDRDTTGILMLNKPFFLRDRNGEEFALFLMDTQGSFDHTSTIKQCATVFGLSTILSSMQIYNLNSQIQENDLQNLNLFTEFGKLATSHMDETPLQSLLFLVRDWVFENEYGFSGGQQYLSGVLKQTSNQHDELRDVRRDINNSFASTSCFLLPHPGASVARCNKNDGSLPEMDEDFRTQVCDLTRQVMSSKHLFPKTINGEQVTCGKMFEYFKAYMTTFTSEQMPTPTSILAATAEVFNSEIVSNAYEVYSAEMSEPKRKILEVCQSIENLEEIHGHAQVEATTRLKNIRKIGGQSLCAEYRKQLMEKITTFYDPLEKKNTEVHSSEVSTKALDMYTGIMSEYEDKVLCRKYVENLQDKHLEAQEKATKHLLKIRRTCGESFYVEYQKQLTDQIKIMYEQLEKENTINFNLEKVDEAFEMYTSAMFSSKQTVFVEQKSIDNLQELHEKAQVNSIAHLENIRTIDGEDFSEKYQMQLTDKITAAFNTLNQKNGELSWNEWVKRSEDENQMGNSTRQDNNIPASEMNNFETFYRFIVDKFMMLAGSISKLLTAHEEAMKKVSRASNGASKMSPKMWTEYVQHMLKEITVMIEQEEAKSEKDGNSAKYWFILKTILAILNMFGPYLLPQLTPFLPMFSPVCMML